MKNKKIYLSNKRVIEISGSNSVKFLNNILTADLSNLKQNEILFSTLLTPQGRILFDVLISIKKTDINNSILLECHIDQLDSLLTKLNLYNLRKEVTIVNTEYKVIVTDSNEKNIDKIMDHRFIGFAVSRIYYMKLPNEGIFDVEKTSDLTWYDLYRYKCCVPEGPNEIMSGISLPLELNLDLLNAISFEKGCFIGQEVNARIKWRGLIKNKYVPIQSININQSIKKIDVKDEQNIYFEDKAIGKMIVIRYSKKTAGYHGMANIKLSYLYEFEKNKSLACDFKNIKLKINFPKYLLPLPQKR
jgi:folate-binding protein YgfZ